MSYKYRGNIHDVKPKKANEPAPFDTSACGTYKGYRRHMKHGVETCAECKAANAVYMKRWRDANPQPRNPRPVGEYDPRRCGTRTGYNLHRMQGTLTCGPCRDAHATHTRNYRAARAAA